MLAALANVLACALLSSCSYLAYIEKPRDHVAVHVIPAKATNDRSKLVLVLPGISDTIATMRASGIADAVQQSMPDADVALVELTLPYYIHAESARYLHNEVVLPAKARGYRNIYLAGASLGGMGVLMYEREYKNEMRGLILFAPFMGDAALLNEIRAAGGLARWNPGSPPKRLHGGNTPRENWRLLRSWSRQTTRTREVWLVCGAEDRFHTAATIIAELLPPQNFVILPGGHNWNIWTQGASEVFSAIEARQAKVG